MPIELFESPSVEISRDGGQTTQWPVLMARIETMVIAHEFEELGMTPEEVVHILENVFERLNEELEEHMATYLTEVRS